MSFNPDPLKEAQEVNFSSKMTKTNHPTLIFNDNSVQQVVLQKHLGMFLDCKLNFEEHLKTIVNKINKTIGLLCKFQNFLPRKSLLAIYKSFIRSHLGYGNITYGQTYNTSFHQRLEESLQNNAVLAITGATRGTSKEKNYNELESKTKTKTCNRFKIDDDIKNYPSYTKLFLTNLPLLSF